LTPRPDNLVPAWKVSAIQAAEELSGAFGPATFELGEEGPVAEQGAPQHAGLLSILSGDARLVGRTFSLFVLHEAWPRSNGQFLYLGGLAGTSALLEAHKERLRQEVQGSAFDRHAGWTDVGGTLGLTPVTYLTAAALYLGGLAAGKTEVRRTGLILAESVLVAQGVAELVNFGVSERRPEAGGAIRFFHSGGSSVSIHMTNTAALARVLDHCFARLEPTDSHGRRLLKILAKVVIYSIPAVTAWQRVRSDQHYLWNVVLGGGLSAYVTDGMLRAYDRETTSVPTQ